MPRLRSLLVLLVVPLLTASCQPSAPPEGTPDVEPDPRESSVTQPAWSLVGGGPARTGRTTDAGPATAPGVLWSTPLTSAATCDVVRARAIERELLVIAAAEQVIVLDADDGRVVWTQHVNGVVGTSPLVVGEELFVPTLDGQVFFLSLADGTERAVESWDFPIGGPPLGIGGFVLFEETSYSARDPLSAVRAWDPAADSEAWRQMFTGGLSGQLAADEERVYVVARSALHAWSVADGTPAWTHEFPPQARVVGPWLEGDLAVIVRGGHHLFTAEALDRRTGALRWSQKLVGNVSMPPALTKDDLLVGFTDGRLVRHGLKDGALRGETKLASMAEIQPIIAPERVYYGLRHVVGALSREDWQTVPWEVEFDGGVASMLPLGDRLIVVTDDAFVHALGAAR